MWIVQNDTKNKRDAICDYSTWSVTFSSFISFLKTNPYDWDYASIFFRGTRRMICFSAWELWVHSLLHLLQFKVLGFNFALICTFSSFISFLLISLYHCDASWTRTRETSLIHLLPSIEGLELVNLITTDKRSNWGTVGKIEYFLKNKNYLEFVFYQTTICLWLL